jgi:hypothetical protein
MNYVALKMLFGDRAKYLMLLCGLTFCVMLIVQQGSIFWGLMIWSQSGISNLNVQIWVTDPNISQVAEVKPIAPTTVERVRSVPWVEWAVPLYRGAWPTASITRSRSWAWTPRPSSAVRPTWRKGASKTCGRRMRSWWTSGRWNGWADRR